jgi:L-fuculose-phosphate aldolase
MNEILGPNLMHPRDRLKEAEFNARSLVLAKSIGQLVPIKNRQVDELRKVFLKK